MEHRCGTVSRLRTGLRVAIATSWAVVLAAPGGAGLADSSMPPAATQVETVASADGGGDPLVSIAIDPAGSPPPSQPAQPPAGVPDTTALSPSCEAAVRVALAGGDPTAACIAEARAAAARALVPFPTGAGDSTRERCAAGCPAGPSSSPAAARSMVPLAGLGPAGLDLPGQCRIARGACTIGAAVPPAFADAPIAYGDLQRTDAAAGAGAGTTGAAGSPAAATGSGSPLASTGMPIVAGLAGFVLIVVGSFLTWKRARG
jgi:hypothetical protein